MMIRNKFNRKELPKAIIFDSGGVLAISASRNFLCEFAVREGLVIEDVVAAWKKCIPPLLIGKISEDDFFTSFVEEFDLHKPIETLVPECKKQIREYFYGDDEMITFVKNLKRKDLKLAVLSNTSKEWSIAGKDSAEFSSLFDLVLLSCDVGITKPDPAIFKLVTERLGVKLEESIFVDNNAVNVAAATVLGMHAVLFTDIVQCKELIEKLLKGEE